MIFYKFAVPKERWEQYLTGLRRIRKLFQQLPTPRANELNFTRLLNPKLNLVDRDHLAKVLYTF